MKFHSLIAAILLLLAFDRGASLLGADALAAPPGVAGSKTVHAYVYQNGDLVLDIRDSLGAEVLAYFFQHEHCATADELRSGGTQPETAPLPEPLSVGLLGAGIALLGWTRRQGSWVESLKRKLGRLNVLPWPGLCWLD